MEPTDTRVMDYNTEREQLILPEYGRMVQKMVDYAVTLQDRDERQTCARTIVKIMGNICPQILQMPDAQNVLWDHLARMSRYQLDIDYPVAITREEDADKRPAPLEYPMKDIRLRHYGYILESLIKKMAEMEDGDEKNKLLELTANQMWKDLYYWNQDAMDEEKIMDDLARYTKGQVQVESGQLNLSKGNPTGRQLRGGNGRRGRRR